METAEQLLEKLNRQFRAGEPAAVLLRTISALENAIRHHPPRVRDVYEEGQATIEPELPQIQPTLPEPEPIIQILEVDEAEIEEELRALKEAAELRQIRQQHLRPDLAHLDEEIPDHQKSNPLPIQPKQLSHQPTPEPAPVQSVPPSPSTPKKQATELNDAMSNRTASLNDSFRNAGPSEDRPKYLEPVHDIRKAIGINDRFRFVNDLFSGDAQAFANTIVLINQAGSIAEARGILELKIREKGFWQPEHPSFKDLLQLLERRYS